MEQITKSSEIRFKPFIEHLAPVNWKINWRRRKHILFFLNLHGPKSDIFVGSKTYIVKLIISLVYYYEYVFSSLLSEQVRRWGFGAASDFSDAAKSFFCQKSSQKLRNWQITKNSKILKSLSSKSTRNFKTLKNTGEKYFLNTLAVGRDPWVH